MIDFVTKSEMMQQLESRAPIGLRLRPLLHARYATDPLRVYLNAIETSQEPGLGTINIVSCHVDEIPMTLVSMDLQHYFGLEVRAPVMALGSEEVIASLSALELPVSSSQYLESFPVETGYHLVADGDSNPVFSTDRLAEAAAARSFLSAQDGRVYAIVETQYPDTRWIAFGPRCGQYISRGEVLGSKEEAEGQALAWMQETGGRFLVCKTLSEMRKLSSVL